MSQVKVFKFGARLTPEAQKEAARIFELQARHFNARADLFAESLRYRRELLAQSAPEIVALEDELEQIWSKDARRGRAKGSPEAAAAVARSSEIRAELKVLRRQRSPEVREATKLARSRFYAQVSLLERDVRKGRCEWQTEDLGVYHHFQGEATVQASEAACRRKHPKTFQEIAPRHRRGSDIYRGSISVRYTAAFPGGVPVERILGEGVESGIGTMTPTGRWVRGGRSEIMTARLRIGTGCRKPIWLSCTFVRHREIPPGSLITGMSLGAEIVAGRRVWHLRVSAKSPVAKTCGPGGGAVAIDLGWRKDAAGGYRACAWAASDGRSGSLVLPSRLARRFDQAERIQSVRDELKNETLARFRRALDQAEDDRFRVWWGGRPDLQRILTNSDSRIRQSSLSYVASEVSRELGGELGEPVRGPTAWLGRWDDAAGILIQWAARDRHLWQYQVGTDRRARLSRRDAYRVFAAELARKYDSLVLMDDDLSGMAVKSGRKENKLQTNKDRVMLLANANRVRVSPHELKSALCNAFGKSRTATVACAYTSSSCAECGEAQTMNGDEVHVCTVCGACFDRDVNACRNALIRAAWAGSEAAEKVGDEGRFARRKRAKAERLEEVGDASAA